MTLLERITPQINAFNKIDSSTIKDWNIGEKYYSGDTMKVGDMILYAFFRIGDGYKIISLKESECDVYYEISDCDRNKCLIPNVKKIKDVNKK